MKIAFLVNRFPVLSQTFILNQITGLIDRGHEVHIFSNSSGDTLETHEDVKKYNLLKYTYFYSQPFPLNKASGWGPIIKYCYRRPKAIHKVLSLWRREKREFGRTFRAAITFLNKGPYDIIHCHFGPNGVLAVSLKSIGAIEGKIITAFHGYDISSYIIKHGNDAYKNLFIEGDLFLPVSERWKNKLIQLGCDKRKIIVHRMGIDTNEFISSRNEQKNNDKIRLLSIGRLIEKKGMRYSILAVAKLLKKYPDIEYNIVGDGPLKNSLENLIEELRSQNNIKLIGWKRQSEVITLLKNSDIFIAPSVTGKDGDLEGIPVVLMESLATCLPVISTRHSGIPELIEDGKSGFLVPEGDSDAVAEKLEFLINHREKWQEIGGTGREHVEKYYNIGTLNDELIEIYCQLLKKQNS